MAFTNFQNKEIHCKVIYFGPNGSGKTENLRSIFTQTSAEIKSGLLELHEQDGSTRFFDFLPLSIGQLGEFHLKMHLFTLPTSTLYYSTTSVIMRGVDGFVFVADSRVESLVDNIRSMQQCKKILQEEGYNINELAKVIQYNKRDLQGVLPVSLLRQELNPAGEHDIEASATANFGTVECLESIARQIVDKLELSRKSPGSSGRDNTGANYDDTHSLPE